MKKTSPRTPKNYNGTKVTSHHLGDILPSVLSQMTRSYEDHPDLILASWPRVIGSKLAAMTQAVRFEEGVLYVKVKNSTLFSLLNQSEKPKVLANLRKTFPKVRIANIVFRIG